MVVRRPRTHAPAGLKPRRQDPAEPRGAADGHQHVGAQAEDGVRVGGQGGPVPPAGVVWAASGEPELGEERRQPAARGRSLEAERGVLERGGQPPARGRMPAAWMDSRAVGLPSVVQDDHRKRKHHGVHLMSLWRLAVRGTGRMSGAIFKWQTHKIRLFKVSLVYWRDFFYSISWQKRKKYNSNASKRQ